MEEFEPKLKLWQKALVSAVFVCLCLAAFVVDKREVATEKPGNIEQFSSVLDVTLSLVAFAILLNFQRIAEWIIRRFVEELERRGLVLKPASAPQDAYIRTAGGVDFDETETENAESSKVKTMTDEQRFEESLREIAREERRQRVEDRARRWRRAALLHELRLPVLLTVLFLSALLAAWLWLGRPSPWAPAPVPAATLPTEVARCPPGCSQGEEGFACLLVVGSDPTSLARALLPEEDDVAVALLAEEIWEQNRESLGLLSDRNIPPGTLLSIPEREGLCSS